MSSVAAANRRINQVDNGRGAQCLREDYDIEAGYYLHREKLGEGKLRSNFVTPFSL